MLSAVGYAAVAGTATWWRPNVFLVPNVPYPVFLLVGTLLLTTGLVMLPFSARAMAAAYGKDQLVTTGMFGVVRHPIYSAWIVFLIPGIVLLTRSWLLFLTPLVAYIAFKARIRQEDKYLEKRFGQAYLEYRRRVNEIIPIPRFRA